MIGQSKSKSPNVEAIETLIQPNYVVTIEAGDNTQEEYLLERRLGYGNFAITYRGRLVRSSRAGSLLANQTVAIKIQEDERASSEAQVFREIEKGAQCDQIVDFYAYGVITCIKDASGRIDSDPGFEGQLFVRPEGGITPAFIEGLALLQAGDAKAWQVLAEARALIAQKRRLGCIIMEFVDGVALSEKRAPFELDEAVRIAAEICKAVDHMHRWHYVHGDLKPENVIISRQGEVKIVDFSTTKREGGINPTIATSFYAPAIQHMKHEVTFYSDLYSLVAIFYRLATSREPGYLYGLTTGRESGYLYGSEHFIVKIKKHFEYIRDIPTELRYPICETIIPSIRELSAPVYSDHELETRIMIYGVNNPVRIAAMPSDIIEYVPAEILNWARNSPPRNALEVAGALKQGYQAYRNRKQVVPTIPPRPPGRPLPRERTQSGKSGVGLLIPLIVVLIVFLFLRSMVASGSHPVADQTTAQTPNVQASTFQSAREHFETALRLHEQAEKLEEQEQKNRAYRKALDGYNEGIVLYQAVLKYPNVSQLDQGVVYKDLFAATWNMYLIYQELSEFDNSMTYLVTSMRYLELGRKKYPEDKDLLKLIKGYTLLGIEYQDHDKYDESINAYQKCVYYLSDSKMPKKDISVNTVVVIVKLKSLLELSDITVNQKEQIQQMLSSLDGVLK